MRRPNNSGSISWDKTNSKWRAWIKDDEGKRIIKRFAERSDAENWLAEMRVKLNKGLYIPSNSKTFGEFSVEYLDTFCTELRPKTQADYLYTLGLLKPLYSIPLQKLNALQVQRTLNKLTCAVATKKKVYGLLKRIIKKARQLKYIEQDFTDALTSPSGQQSFKVKVFTEDEIKKILNYAKSSLTYRRYYPIIYTAVLTGMRLGEILGLRYVDVTPTSITVSQTVVEVLGRTIISKPKTIAGQRVIAIPEELGRMLLNYNNKNAMPTDLVFRSHNNTPIAQNNFGKHFRDIQKAAGVERKNFHCLRHSHASVLLQQNYDLASLSMRLGHQNISTTLKFYGHYLPGKEEKVIEKLKAFTKKGPERDQLPTDFLAKAK